MTEWLTLKLNVNTKISRITAKYLEIECVTSKLAEKKKCNVARGYLKNQYMYISQKLQN